MVDHWSKFQSRRGDPSMKLAARLAACLFPLLAASSWPAAAQEFPQKTITMVVGFAPGGGADTAARIIARKVGENLGQTIVIDNKAGAGGNLAHQQVANAPPDGTMILLGSVGPLAVAPHMMKVGYDPLRDLAPLTMGVTFPNVLVVPSGLGVKTLAEFVALAKSKPGGLDYASTGAGSASHLAGELFNQRAGVEIVHIPYKGGSQAMQDLLAGRVSSYFSVPSTAMPHVETGKLVAIATTGATRSEFLPNLPTVAESGFPGFSAVNWYAFVAPGKTPPAILDRWNRELVKALNSPDVKDELQKRGLTPAPGTREELGRTIATESVTWEKVIRERKITAN
jgi:tripartite-type tricarboxylate transporter receptor subunit TctC